MGKFCKYCGSPLEEDAAFCTGCGKSTEEKIYTGSVEGTGRTAFSGRERRPVGDVSGIEERNIALCIIFSIVTCGIYGLYWMYKLNDELNQLAGDDTAFSGGLVILLCIVTFGIYGWYWCYKMGEKVDQLTGSDSNKVLFIVLAVLQVSIVNFAIMQDTVNRELR